MSAQNSTAAIQHLTSDAIRAHPQFNDARNAFVEAAVRLYENNPFLTRLFLEAGRQLVFSAILSLHARYDPADRMTWPTVARVKTMMVQYGVSSPRRLEALVSRLVDSGFVTVETDPIDRRVRSLAPTETGIQTGQDWLALQYVPLDVMYPQSDYRLAVTRDPDFHVAFFSVGYDAFGKGATLLAGNPGIMLFLTRDAGFMILTKLIQLAATGDKVRSVNISLKALGGLFGVSRSHVFALLHDAEAAGFIAFSGRGGHSIDLTPAAFEIYDRFVADSMAGNSLMFVLAMQRLHSAQAGLQANA